MLPFDKMPYTNFHELNLAYFIVHFREIFAEWETLYNKMVAWREQTDADLTLWKTDTLNAIEDYKRDLTDAWDAWKAETALDITDWKNETLNALDAWKTAFQTLFDSTFSNLSQIKTDAEAARDAAVAAQNAAANSAASVAASAAQIETNKEDIIDLKNAYDEVFTTVSTPITADRNSSDMDEYGLYGYLAYTDGHFVPDAEYHVFTHVFENDTDIYFSRLSGGLIMGVLYSEELQTIPTSSSASSKYYIKGARSDKADEYAFPTSENPWHCTAGQMIAFSTQDTQSIPNTNFELHFNILTPKLTNIVALDEYQINEVLKAIKKPIIEYCPVDTDIGPRGKEQISVFIPTKRGYIKYAFVRCEYDASNSNIWRIDKCYACNDDLTVRFPITNSGEWEMAIKITGASDFIGGNAHGDEVYTAFHVLVDGVEIDDITALTKKEFNIVNIIETSLMYNPRDGATLSTREQFAPVGTHGREYIITQDGIRLTQAVVLNTALTLGASYMTMLPIIRGNDAVSELQITDHYTADNNYTEYDISVGGSGDGYGWKKHVTRAEIWGNASGISATVEMLKQPDIINEGARQFQVQSTVDVYNKLYWSICGVGDYDYNANANERFDTDTLYKINAN